MKPKLARLSRRYATVLRKHLKQGSRASLQAALRMGRDAVALGLEMLELARIHEQALTVPGPARHKRRTARRAENFFTKASTPIIEARQCEVADKITLNRLKNPTSRRAAELEVTNRELQRGIVQRKIEANDFHKSRDHQSKRLGEALRLERHLQQDSHRALAAQEEERRKISHQLQDEIAQTLLGINVRLLSLRQKARSKFKGLKNEIASTQRLVVESAKSVRQFARKLDNRQEEQSNRPDSAP